MAVKAFLSLSPTDFIAEGTVQDSPFRLYSQERF